MKDGINQLKVTLLVGAQPPPCCSFARHLVEKLVIRCKNLLVTSRTAQIYGLGPVGLGFQIWVAPKNHPLPFHQGDPTQKPPGPKPPIKH